jgi:hypothetical protein
MWVRHTAFADDLREMPDSLERSLLDLEDITLPAILAKYQAQSWLAEGLIRLYLVEGLLTRFGGSFDRLDVGPATATAVRVNAKFRLDGFQQSLVSIEGAVPLQS